MKSEAEQQLPPENQENEFIDFIVGASVFGGLLFGIFIVATIAKFFI